jgi:hypothetical protein
VVEHVGRAVAPECHQTARDRLAVSRRTDVEYGRVGRLEAAQRLAEVRVEGGHVQQAAHRRVADGRLGGRDTTVRVRHQDDLLVLV